MYIFKYWKEFYKYLGRWMIAILIISPLVGILDSIGITLIIPVLANVLETDEASDSDLDLKIQAFFDMLGFSYSQQLIIWGLLLVFIVKAILRFANLSIMSWMAADFWCRIRKDSLSMLGEVKYNYYLETNSGTLVNSITSETKVFLAGAKSFLNSIISGLLLVGYGVMLVVISAKATLLLFILAFAFNYIFVLINGFGKRLSKVSTQLGQLFSINILEAINHFKYLKSTGTYSFKFRTIEKVIQDNFPVLLKTGIFNGMPNVIQEIISILIIIVLFWLNSLLLHESIEFLLVLLGIAYRSSNILSKFNTERQKFFSTIGSLENVKKLLSDLKENKELINAKPQTFSEYIKFENLHFSYPNGTAVLRDINISIEKNKTIALVGPSGAGKSTFVDILTGLQQPTNGEIVIDGVPYQGLNSINWRSQIGYVTQENIVFDGDVTTNVTLYETNNGTNNEINESFLKALKWSNSLEFVSKLENQYQTDLGEKGVRLSGGQRQRISIARELYKQPKVLILDEATSALDSLSEKLIQKSIDNLKGKTTVIIIAHRLSTVRNVDKIYVLAEGLVVESGTYDDLLAKGGRFKSMVDNQRL